MDNVESHNKSKERDYKYVRKRAQNNLLRENGPQTRWELDGWKDNSDGGCTYEVTNIDWR